MILREGREAPGSADRGYLTHAWGVKKGPPRRGVVFAKPSPEDSKEKF